MHTTDQSVPFIRRVKTFGHNMICGLLEAQVHQLRAKHHFQIIAVVGSVGKTGTKMAVARMLSVRRQVRYQEGNNNERRTVPLIIFGHQPRHLWDIVAWAKILYSNWQQIRGPFPYDVVVVELGTDGPGQIGQFAYLQPDLTIITSIAAEHMEFFGTLDAVAAEELSIVPFSKSLLINIDDTPEAYIKTLVYAGYGVGQGAQYRLTGRSQKTDLSQNVAMTLLGNPHPLVTDVRLLGVQGAKMALVAAAVARMYGLDGAAIKTGLAAQAPLPGRMQPLKGVHVSLLIDDTYNASPTAVLAALQTLYSVGAPQRVAILGSMNELGAYTKQAHQRVGNFCAPHRLDFVVTIGQDAQEHLAPAAQKKGCQVASFASPYAAGAFVKKLLRPGAVVLGKGSQNGVFAEEAIKQLLQDEADSAKLVRQSPSWLKIKRQQFMEGASRRRSARNRPSPA